MESTELKTKFSDWHLPANYKIVKLLGSGAYGQVVEAMDTITSKTVAIKRIGNLFVNFEDTKRIYREISILKNLKNEQIIKLYSVFWDTEQNEKEFNVVYLVLEHFPTDLSRLIHSPLYLTLENVRRISYNILKGLQYLHENNILHRDIKPANILINENCQIKICDFGLARQTQSPTSKSIEELSPLDIPRKSQKIRSQIINIKEVPFESEIIQNDSTKDIDNLEQGNQGIEEKDLYTQHVTTRWYRAPELILLERNYQEQVDIWSFGCVFAELLGMLKQNLVYWKERKPLFPGQSCFPLSPREISTANQNQEKTVIINRSRQDQMSLILQLLGKPAEDQINFVTDQNARKYIQSFHISKPLPWKMHFPGIDCTVKDVLTKTLAFQPQDRSTATELLQLQFFAAYQEKKEKPMVNTSWNLKENVDWKELGWQELRTVFTALIKEQYPRKL